MRRRARIPATAALAGGVTVVLWASAFVGIRSASRHLEAGPLALGRLLVAAGVLGALTLLRRSRRGERHRGERHRSEHPNGGFSRRDGGAILLCGVLWFGAYNLALNEAERRVDAGTAAMLVNVGPILIALLAGVVLREGLPRNLARGLAVAFTGAVVIGLATRSRSAAEGTGALLCLLAALFYASAVVAQKPVLARHAPLEVTFLACLAGLVVCLPFAPRLFTELRHAPAGAIAWTVYLGAGPTAIAFTTWAYALTRTTAGRMGALTYLVPPLAVLFGWLLLGETPPALAILGGALCLAGVALTRAGNRPRGGRSGGERAVRVAAVGLACTVAVAAAAGPSRAASAPLGSDARLELVGDLEPTVYPPGTSPLGAVAADGANSVNAAWERGAGPGLYIEEQRHGEEAILDGLVRHSARLWRAGLREFTWGFARQGRAGDFPGTNDPFHSTSFFVEGVAHTILVIRGGAAAGLPVPRALVRALNRLVGPLHAAARWMARPDVWRAGIEGEAPFTHRRFLVAAAVGLTGKLTADRTLARLGHQSMLLGLARQRADGVFPELGGPDSSYQLRGIAYAEQYLGWVRDPAANRLTSAIARGLRWELTRIRPSGQVLTAGNTRANGVMVDHNGPKQIVYPMVARGLAWWGIVMRAPRLLAIARRIVSWSVRHPAHVGR